MKQMAKMEFVRQDRSQSISRRNAGWRMRTSFLNRAKYFLHLMSFEDLLVLSSCIDDIMHTGEYEEECSKNVQMFIEKIWSRANDAESRIILNVLNRQIISKNSADFKCVQGRSASARLKEKD